MEAPEFILEVQDLNKAFGGLQATANVNFKVRAGEILGVLGPNGSGKTTLVNLISGFVKPDSGKVFFKGKNITGRPPHRIANLGLVPTFQIMRPYYSLAAFKNLIIPLNSPRVLKSRTGKLAIPKPWPSISWRRSASSGMPGCRTRRPELSPWGISSASNWDGAWPCGRK